MSRNLLLYDFAVPMRGPLLDVLPDPDHIFDKVWEQSALLAIITLIAVALGLLCAFLWRVLEAERKAHKASCAEKDLKIEQLNERFIDEGHEHLKVTTGLITKLEELRLEVKGANCKRDVQYGNQQIKNGLRAVAEHLDISSASLGMDNMMIES
jgi:hypothetical protein